ncbi:MAG: peptide-methionine (S)-S-oxide reductase MsrA [Actinomycetota bacterium]|nr:peptide-methionine (S)-S-oxide reductase MsrA [Actinomycetota bacterium]
MLFARAKSQLPTPDTALRGRPARPYPLPARHAVTRNPLEGPFPEGLEVAVFGMGCFWGAERRFWQLPGVWSTAAGYAGGITAHPTYDEVCSGLTGHTEVVQVVYDPATISYDDLLRVFWEAHDPTQGYRQGNDVGTQYRSSIYWTNDAQRVAAERSRAAYQQVLRDAGYGAITTELAAAGSVYLAEDYHQQYLHKVPNGYCGLAGTGVSCPVGVVVPAVDGPAE